MEEEFWYVFEQAYRCYPLSKAPRPNPESYGNKILMPSSALDTLLSLPINYPMMFLLHNPTTGKYSHCGVSEFTAEEGTIIMPDWMMENMKLEEGDIAVIRDTSLEKGNYVKLQPHNVAFVELKNPKAVLETLLRSFFCLTTGDTIMIVHNNKKFYIDVLETKPSRAISIIDTDCEVDFATPLDYKEAQIKERQLVEEKLSNLTIQEQSVDKFVPFVGNATRLDGKPSTVAPLAASDCSSASKHESSCSGSESQSHGLKRNVTSGTLVFGYNGKVKPSKNDEKIEEEEKSKKEKQSFQPFSGKSYKLMD